MKHLIDLDDFSLNEINSIIDKATEIKKNPHEFSDIMHGKIIGTLFYEPSTRTQMSFQTAMLKLGGQVIGFNNPQNSSVAKGENFKDTIKIIGGYADIIAIRHPLEGAAKAASLFANCPIINAGDGSHLHPTQTLTDLLTIAEQKNTLNGLTMGFCGDLKYGRTVHSLVKTMLKYKNNKFIFISTKELKIPNYIKNIIISSGNSFEEIFSLKDAIDNLDILYMTRIQKERFKSIQDYNLQKDIFKLTTDKLKNASPNMIILHPLPRVDEIDISVDDDPRALYFKQASNGVFVRMSLILHILSTKTDENVENLTLNESCNNKSCITNHEKYLPHYFKKDNNSYFCEYCSREIKL